MGWGSTFADLDGTVVVALGSVFWIGSLLLELRSKIPALIAIVLLFSGLLALLIIAVCVSTIHASSFARSHAYAALDLVILVAVLLVLFLLLRKQLLAE